ncbi:Sensor protein EvgS precursor [Thalassovita gelatinovora]|uniref:histidine kinase n=1 Tax=Thalassovita gelatinovora TaxID=53501 RepID=A0A0P1G0Y8_THAGE|nr:ATP-binding protein [Thalassovita gelatinovora]QIZ79612.1 response regulator [Thalassovita gelatinovora]CUH66536.1 Sensor protein EvgS precursor [Thalassovita gelatinovora]SEQ37533.1 PAS/PAC sensor hybrid histidine kinase [Thalassovita gelatinovora]
MFGDSRTLEQQGKKWVWAAWVGLACSLLIAVVFLTNTLWRIADILEQRHNQTRYQSAVVSEIEIDLTRLHDLSELALMSAPGDGAFERLRLEFADVRSRIEDAQEKRNGWTEPGETPLERLIKAQVDFLAQFQPVMELPDAEIAHQLGAMIVAIDRLGRARGVAVTDYLIVVQSLMEDNNHALFGALKQFAVSTAAIMVFLVVVIVLDGTLLLKLRQKNGVITRAINNLRAAVETSRDASVVLNAEGVVVSFSSAAEKLFGVDQNKAKGRPFTDFMISALPEKETLNRFSDWVKAPPKWFKDGGRLDMEGKKPDGGPFPIEVGFGILKGADNEDMLIASIRDLTAQAEREKTLMQARNEALQAERAKSRFLSSMSHEMRTPLNGVLASLDLMRETTLLNARQLELAGIIERCGDDALEQVQNVLELTRLDAMANTPVELAPFAPAALLNKLVVRAESRARLGRNVLKFESNVPNTLLVEGAEVLFRQIMQNLLSNAIKFTSGGKIKVTLSAEDVGDGNLAIRASVIDTGIGIASEDLERIFGNFETIRESYSTFNSGTGLGLSIVQHSAELMNARISVDSTPGKGSEFALEVEWPKVEGTADNLATLKRRNVKDQEKSALMDILVVEDNEINRRMLVDMLRAKGHSVAEAVDGLEGVSMGRDTAYDLILMDISMPKLDGVGATRMLRQAGKSRNVPIVAVTAHSQPEHLKEFLDSGMDRVLTKPLRMSTLDQLFQDLGAIPSRTDNGPEQEEHDDMQSQVDVAKMIDQDVFNGLLDMLDAESLGSYLDQFERDAEAVLPAYLAALDANDFATARAEAHRCAGGAAVIGAAEVHSVLQDMTHAADAQDAAKGRALSGPLLKLTTDTLAVMRARLS